MTLSLLASVALSAYTARDEAPARSQTWLGTQAQHPGVETNFLAGLVVVCIFDRQGVCVYSQAISAMGKNQVKLHFSATAEPRSPVKLSERQREGITKPPSPHKRRDLPSVSGSAEPHRRLLQVSANNTSLTEETQRSYRSSPACVRESEKYVQSLTSEHPRSGIRRRSSSAHIAFKCDKRLEKGRVPSGKWKEEAGQDPSGLGTTIPR